MDYKARIENLKILGKSGRRGYSNMLHQWHLLQLEINDLIYDYNNAILKTKNVMERAYIDRQLHANAIKSYEEKLLELMKIKEILEDIPPEY